MNAKDTANLIYEIQRDLADINSRLEKLKSAISFEQKQGRLALIEEQMAEPGFWEKKNISQEIQQEKSQLMREVERFKKALINLADYQELIELVKDDELTLSELGRDVSELNSLVTTIELERMLSGEHDQNNAILSINVG